MMLRCAACISSGSACAIAFNAAVRSPVLIASSTRRTAPRIWVRRDLLMVVRRAILRVAFLAEVVLAIVSNILRAVTVRLTGRAQARRPFNAVIDAGGLKRVPENACRANSPIGGAAQRTAAAGLRPPPLAPL